MSTLLSPSHTHFTHAHIISHARSLLHSLHTRTHTHSHPPSATSTPTTPLTQPHLAPWERASGWIQGPEAAPRRSFFVTVLYCVYSSPPPSHIIPLCVFCPLARLYLMCCPELVDSAFCPYPFPFPPLCPLLGGSHLWFTLILSCLAPSLSWALHVHGC
jgi:hypothetical protein